MEIINNTNQDAKVRVGEGGSGVDSHDDRLCEKEEDTSRWPLVPPGGKIRHSPLPPGPWTVCFVVNGCQVVREVRYANDKVTLAPEGGAFEVKVAPDPAADLSAPETTALRRGGFELAPLSHESANALARTTAEYAVLRSTSLTAGEAAQKLGVDPSRVRKLLADRKIYGLQIRGAWKIPIFQFEDERLLPGLEEIVPALPKDLHPMGVYHWFTTPNPDLTPEGLEREMSPREWLLTGHSPRIVAELASDLDNL